jgi:integrase
LTRELVIVNYASFEIQSSSMVEQSAVNRSVVGSSPTFGANLCNGFVNGERQNVPPNIPLDAVQALANAASALAAIASALQGNFRVTPQNFGIQNGVTGVTPSLVETVNELLKVKARAGRCDGYLKLLRIGLRSFAVSVGGNKPLHEIFSQDVERWFDRMNYADRTKRGHLDSVSLLFNFAKRRGYCRENPVAGFELPQCVTIRETKIHSPGEVEKVLHYWQRRDLSVCRHLAIRYFAGLRTVEMQRADESRIHLERSFIEVSDAMAKQTKAPRRRRLVTIQPNLKAWLKLGGEIPLTSFCQRAATFKNCGVDFPDNVTRHSFVSYHLAKFQSAGKTALESGHDEKVLFTDYREVVTPEDAEKYFNIFPA